MYQKCSKKMFVNRMKIYVVYFNILCHIILFYTVIFYIRICTLYILHLYQEIYRLIIIMYQFRILSINAVMNDRYNH